MAHEAPTPSRMSASADCSALRDAFPALFGPVADCCAYKGVTCVNSRISELRLPFAGLTGQIPQTLASLTELTWLSLRNNRLEGPIPPIFDNMTKLTYLHLWENALTGPIPPSIGLLPSLKELAVNDNSLSGGIPPSIVSSKSLIWLFFYNNPQMSGQLPRGIQSLVCNGENTAMCFPSSVPSGTCRISKSCSASPGPRSPDTSSNFGASTAAIIGGCVGIGVLVLVGGLVIFHFTIAKPHARHAQKPTQPASKRLMRAKSVGGIDEAASMASQLGPREHAKRNARPGDKDPLEGYERASTAIPLSRSMARVNERISMWSQAMEKPRRTSTELHELARLSANTIAGSGDVNQASDRAASVDLAATLQSSSESPDSAWPTTYSDSSTPGSPTVLRESAVNDDDRIDVIYDPDLTTEQRFGDAPRPPRQQSRRPSLFQRLVTQHMPVATTDSDHIFDDTMNDNTV
ncbi:hypothetical protein BC831DRAFT_275640 [Entophlyctis helioformis]|nr:hypothetical protein BC831DRAFT_275640 [Entophlyctis helioformis]